MLTLRPVRLQDAPDLHRLYALSPRYFEIISMPMPLVSDVEREIEAALADPRRRLEFVVPDPAVAGQPVGYLDVKLGYPGPPDATINLLLIAEPYQSGGYGARVVRALERRFQAERDLGVRRILAGIYGHNPRAVRFWERLGYRYAIDARPVLEWYARDLGPAAGRSGPAAHPETPAGQGIAHASAD